MGKKIVLKSRFPLSWPPIGDNPSPTKRKSMRGGHSLLIALCALGKHYGRRLAFDTRGPTLATGDYNCELEVETRGQGGFVGQ